MDPGFLTVRNVHLINLVVRFKIQNVSDTLKAMYKVSSEEAEKSTQ